MAVLHLSATESHTSTTGNTGTPNPFTWTHTGGATARGAIVFVLTIASTSE